MSPGIHNLSPAAGDVSLDIDKAPSDTKVVVAMSGGVDSSVVAALLKSAGYDAVGLTLQLYDHGEATKRKGACCAGQDIYDARRVAEALDMPHYVLDYESRFREAVIDQFADSYLNGETPIPCVACNREIKFKDLLATARDLGADALATGHYVSSRKRPDGHRALYAAADSGRDQSYFLFATTQDQLDFVRFPLGEMKKPEVRALAEHFALPVAAKADSQDICFVPDGRYSDIIQKLRPEAGNPGEIVHVDGRVLGKHNGIIHYTVGQRRGIGIALGEPLYVIRLDAAAARVIVGPREALKTHEIVLDDVNWLGNGPIGEAARGGLDIHVKIRSTKPQQPAVLRVGGDGVATVELAGGAEGVAPGQACVFYEAEHGPCRVLGGGFIRRTDSLTHMVAERAKGATLSA